MSLMLVVPRACLHHRSYIDILHTIANSSHINILFSETQYRFSVYVVEREGHAI